MICPNCSDVGKGLKECKKHGKDFIEFKCRYCCSLALWFCWGTTHFCEPCHKKAGKLRNISMDKVPKCKGPGKCPLGGDHKPNFYEYCMGCAVCRNDKENAKKF